MVDLSMLDAEVRSALRRFPPPEPDSADVALLRSVYQRYFRQVAASSPTPGPDVSAEDLSAPSLVDDHAIPVRVYRPAAPVNGRGLVYIHGGAFVMGDLEIEDAKCRALAQEAGCVVVSVDYRLAPEHPFPTPLDDCHSALCWVAANAEQLAIDPQRLGVGGCSAGGALAAGLAALCRDRGGPPLALQLLLYPVLDASMRGPSHRLLDPEGEVRETELMWERYLGGPRSQAAEYASPASRADLAGLPPAYIAIAEFDALRDEALAYAQRLLDAGVSVELRVWPKVLHAVDLFAPGARISRDSVSEQASALARALG